MTPRVPLLAGVLAALAGACGPVRSEPAKSVVIEQHPAGEIPAAATNERPSARPSPPDGLERRELDLNHDGRPDVIKYFSGGVLVREDIDLNFDGMPDVRTFYEGGKLVRKELDLDGDGQVDRVEHHP